MGAIQRAIDSVSHYLVLKTAISQSDHRPGGLGAMLVLPDGALRAFMWGYWPSR